MSAGSKSRWLIETCFGYTSKIVVNNLPVIRCNIIGLVLCVLEEGFSQRTWMLNIHPPIDCIEMIRSKVAHYDDNFNSHRMEIGSDWTKNIYFSTAPMILLRRFYLYELKEVELYNIYIYI